MKKQVKKSDFRRILPPGVQQELVFGILWIRVGELRLVKFIKQSDKVSIQFWGELTPVILQTNKKLSYTSDKRLQQYDVKCPITYFNRYLQDMSKNLQINVVGVGKVLFNIGKYIKPNLQIKDSFVFEPFKQFFPIQGKDKTKIGALQIQMGTRFSPEIAIKQLGIQEQSIKQQSQIRQNFNQRPIQNIIKQRQNQINQQNQDEEHNKSGNSNPQFYRQCQKALDVLALEDRDKVMNFYDQIMEKRSSPQKNKISPPRKHYEDTRIANSLNLQPKPHQDFVAERYNKVEQKKEQMIIQNKINTPTQYRNQIKQEQQFQYQDNQNLSKGNAFPTINPVLTYSNLLMGNANGKDNIKEDFDFEQMPKNILLKKSSSKEGNNRQIVESVQNEKYEIKKKPEVNNDSFFRQFYGQSVGNPYKKEENKSPSSKQAAKYEANIPIVERVVNLKDQFTKVPNNEENINKMIYQPNKHQQAYTRRPIHTEHVIHQKKNSSHLLLNMMVKIYSKSIQIPNLNKFILGYRPFGQKERVKLGPNLKEIITIMCPIGQRQLIQMAHLPFILEIWNPITNEFVGMVKADLHKIYKGFILNGQINQMAIKTNLMPTVVIDEQVNILNIKQEVIGSCFAFIAIGTASQIDAYQNSGKDQKQKIQQKQEIISNKIVPPQRNIQQNTNKEQVKQRKQKASLKMLDQMVIFLDKNNEEIFRKVSQIIEIPNASSITFVDFLNKINAVAFLPLSFLFKQQTQQFLAIISENFNSFNAVKLKLQEEIQQNLKIINKKIKEKTIKQLITRSSFNVISKQKAFIILNSDVKDQKLLNGFFSIFTTNTINVNHLIKMISRETNSIDIYQFITIEEINRIISSNITQWVIKNNIQSTNFMKIFGDVKCPINADEIKIFFMKNNVEISLWESLHLIDIVKKHFNEEDQKFNEISYIAMYNWFVKSQKRFIQKYNKEEVQNNQNQLNKSNTTQKNKKQSRQNEKEMEQDKQQLNEFLEQSQRQQKPIKPIKIQESSIKEKDLPTKIKHTFIIEPIELSLSCTLSGQCIVSYNFPYETQWINSKRFQLFNDKHKYSIKINGKHSFTIKQPIEEYMGETHMKFRINVADKVILVGAIHPDQLMIGKESEQMKIIPLYGDAEGIGGKIKLKIGYSNEQAKQQNLGKQTTYNLFLPKSGFINYLIESKADMHKIRQQLNIKEDFYLVIVLDLFWQSPNLKSHFPIISSKLYPDSNSPQQLSGNLKININPVILEYFKHKTAKLYLNVVYYSKIHANYQKQQTSFGTLTLPLIQIVKNGIDGDYAFKNKLGMLAALVNCKMSYDKEISTQKRNQQFTNKRKDSYWVLLHFLQFLNFQHRNPHSIKFQFVYQGKRHSTQKISLPGQTYHQLQDASILLHLKQQEFIDLKVIPLSLTLNQHQKLAVDIDLATFTKHMGRDRYAVGSQNFIIINQNGKPVNMRLGLKIYVFRGNHLVANFVDALHRNLTQDFLLEMKMPAEIQDYGKMLNLLRKNLRLSTGDFDQIIRELLPNKREHFPIQFYAKQPYYKLEFTPIIASSDAQVDNLCEDLPSQVDPQQLMRYIKNNKISLTNLRAQFLSRYSFGVLNRNGLDKNVSFLGLHNEVDLITFVRKLKINLTDESDLQLKNISNNQSLQNNKSLESTKQLRITLIKGYNFSNLYNGIKPNAFIYLPQFEYRSNTFTRTSEPIIQESIRQILNTTNLTSFKKIKIQVYHQDSPEQVLIGEGSLLLTQIMQNGGTHKVVIDSIMSKRLQALVQVKIQINQQQPEEHIQEEDQLSDMEMSNDCSRIADIIRGHKEEIVDKEELFRSSDQDDY